ncbi:DUF2125 domain-containing protein [Belnapia sp. T18]|uniref:DUF2125 domain-containing protein n=1 Tax=Belnapia arida TaxID=2804533 RepID=A0ABS1TZB3_9PROT|nr:DUF2125 domain-containing protein [Belnapia arida]MBL6077765.1 DUF2125 domain-containing protein [Belnapia arida]
MLLLLLGLGQVALWRWMAGQMEAGLAGWAAARRAEGWVVQHGAPVRGGWPLTARLRVPDFRLVSEGMEWRAPSLDLAIALLRPRRLEVGLAGEHRLRLGAEEWPVTAERLTASLPVERRALPSEAVIEGGGLRAGMLGVAALRLDLETREAAAEGEAALVLRGGLDGVELPVALAGLGRRLERAGLEAVLTGPVPPPGGPRARATAWRDGGGTLALQRLDLAWGPSTGVLAATLSLDQALQPMGAGTLRLTGAEAALEALVAAGVVAPRGAGMARVMLGMLARVPPEGGPPRIEVPVTLERQRLGIAGMAVGRIGAWDWP